MESIISGILSVSLLLVGVVTTFSATSNNASQVSASVRAIAMEVEDRLQTRLQVEQVTLDPDAAGLSVELLNSGQSTISAFNRIDVIVEYYAPGPVKVLQSLTYQATVPAAGEWVVWSIENDNFNPRLLDPGETIVLVLKLPAAIAPGQMGRVTIATPNGVTATFQFAN